MHWRESTTWQQQLLRQTMPRPAQRRRNRGAIEYRGLPSYTGGNRPVGATRSGDGSGFPGMAVQGSKTVRVENHPRGGVRTVLTRRIPHYDLLTTAETAKLRALLKLPQETAEKLSKGNMPPSVRKTHPYAQGTRRKVGRLRGSGGGVSNMAVVNEISGHFAESWSSSHRWNDDGFTYYLNNTAKRKRAGKRTFFYSRALAFGTRKMKAHGPFSTAVMKHLPQIDAEVRRLARVASARHNAQQQLLMGVSNGRNR